MHSPLRLIFVLAMALLAAACGGSTVADLASTTTASDDALGDADAAEPAPTAPSPTDPPPPSSPATASTVPPTTVAPADTAPIDTAPIDTSPVDTAPADEPASGDAASDEFCTEIAALGILIDGTDDSEAAREQIARVRRSIPDGTPDHVDDFLEFLLLVDEQIEAGNETPTQEQLDELLALVSPELPGYLIENCPPATYPGAQNLSDFVTIFVEQA